MGQMKRKRRLLLAIGFTAALVTAYTALCAFPGGTIFPNVTVLGVSLGGLDRQGAADILARAPMEGKMGVGVVIRAENPAGAWETAALPRSAFRLDPVQTAERAWGLGRDLPFPFRGGAWLKCRLAGAEIRPVYRTTSAAEAVLDRLDRALGKPITETLWQTDEEMLTVTKGAPGLLLDHQTVIRTLVELAEEGDLSPLSGPPQATVRLEEFAPAWTDWTQVLAQTARPVRSAVFDPARRLFRREQTGLSFDPDQVETAFLGMAWGETRAFPLSVTRPETTVADLEPRLYQDVLGTCTTTVAGSANRVKNVTLAASLFNGTVLLPGETFSYNETVGRRTGERGFLPAPVYVSGQTVQETGGGVCQGSSTLYLAALRADLEILERYNHGYVPRYVPDGMDAAVYYGVKDLKLRNSRPFPIRLTASVTGRELTVRVLGTRTGEDRVELTSRTTGTTPFKTVYRLSGDLSAGQTRVAVTPYTGCTVEVYRNHYENGVLTDSRLESVNVYRSRDKVVLVSPRDRKRYGL